MSNFKQRENDKQELENQKSFIKSFFEYLLSNKGEEPTRTTDIFLEDVRLRTTLVPVFRTDHYTGTQEKIEDGFYQFSRYTAIIGGIRISAESYSSLMSILGTLS